MGEDIEVYWLVATSSNERSKEEEWPSGYLGTIMAFCEEYLPL